MRKMLLTPFATVFRREVPNFRTLLGNVSGQNVVCRDGAAIAAAAAVNNSSRENGLARNGKSHSEAYSKFPEVIRAP
jgi:hypothetical protein